MVRGERRELASTGVDGFEYGPNALGVTLSSHFVLNHAPELSDLSVTESVLLCIEQHVCAELWRFGDLLGDLVD